MGKSENPECYLFASAVAALVNYPLWKASAINQSGFVKHQGSSLSEKLRLFVSAVSPPYRGVPAVIGGMTWARAMIFYGSDHYKVVLRDMNLPTAVTVALPPLVLSSFVQVVNMPIVRASITMQNPANYDNPHFRSTLSTMKFLSDTKGFTKLWHGLSAGLAKSVPKYITSVVVKDVCEVVLPPAENDAQFLLRATVKSVVAGVAGAALTNPMDVIRNEMFKTDKKFFETIRLLRVGDAHNKGPFGSMAWTVRGLGSNLVAVSLPISMTIFLTDFFLRMKDHGMSSSQFHDGSQPAKALS